MARRNNNQIPDFIIKLWSGLNTSIINPDDMAPGSSPDALNWLTGASQNEKGKYFGDHIEIRRGTSFLQAAAMSGVSPVSGLGVGIKVDGTEIPVFSVGQKVYYYDVVTNANIEIGTNLLGAAAASDDVAIVPYQSLSGYWVIMSSPNSSFYKILLSSIGSPIDLQSFENRGYIAMNQGRTFLWNRKGKTHNDLTNLYLSYADASDYSTNPPIANITGQAGPATDGTTKLFTGVLPSLSVAQNAFGVQINGPLNAINISGITKAASAVVYAPSHGLAANDTVIITGVVGMTQINNLTAQVKVYVDADHVMINVDSTSFGTWSSGGVISKCEFFFDDQNGNMISNLGGTGIINYVSGAYSITFNTAPITGKTLLINYYEDDSGASIDKFFVGTPTLATQGYLSTQPGFGKLMNIFNLSGIYFAIHQFGTYQIALTNNDVMQLVQGIYRNNVGIPYWRAGYATGDGILYLDTLNQASPKLRQLVMSASVSNVNPAIIPQSISDQLNLSLNSFSKAVVYEWGDYYLLACMGLTNGVPDANNDRIYLMNKKTGFYDLVDYRANCFANYYGALIAGDSISPNPLVLFSGFDDLGYNINNYWKTPNSLLNWPGMKKVTKGKIKGLIQPNQNLEVWLSFDNSQYVLYKTIIGQSQNTGIPTTVGGQVVGSTVVGGSGVISAYPYEVEFSIASDVFTRVSAMFVGTGAGYASIDEFTYKDIRLKSAHIWPNL